MGRAKHTVKHSIKRRMAFSFIALMTGTVLFCWVINSTFLQSYYEKNRKQDLITGYHKIIDMILEEQTGEEEFTDQLLALSARANISGIVLDADSEVLYYYGSDSKTLNRRIRDYLYGAQAPGTEVIEQREGYILLKMIDSDTRFEYMELHGIVGTGTYIMLRAPLANVTESVELANRFLIYIGMIAIGLSSIVVWLVTKKITEPILELADISERMTRLDFEAKYTGGDHTEIALLGDNINRLSETLEKTISELKTANNELQKDIEKKNQIDVMRKEFLSNVSHELKTPIALIQGYAEGLQEEINDDPESRRFYCDVIVDEAAKMNHMVKELMTLNQLEFGNDNVSMERFDVVDLICNYIQSAQILTRQNGVSVRMDHYDAVYVWADEFKTEEVFMNYFSNAVNHAEGEKIVDVKLLRREKTVRISVFNTGKPIPEECIGHIWEKFYKVDKARTRQYGGSGVGLSIVKAIMESMNQHYGAANYENGVEFWFELETVN
ncbi:MAG: two-component sensor histidine kinase [Lachnospiraceae bacterium]|nr:two-component sensor histidine kinase [Lachnospiraceae bacterium]